MPFLYFAYGSNLWPPQMHGRCPSARVRTRASLDGWVPVYDKPSRDGSAKLNITERLGETRGVLYEVVDSERLLLDDAEHLYDPVTVVVTTDDGDEVEALTYRWSGPPHSSPPYDWYVAIAQAGAAHQGLPQRYYMNHLSSDTESDPLASGMRPAMPDDLPLMQGILSDALAGDHYSIHPGDLAWWMFHADPRYADQLSFWVQHEVGVLVIHAKDNEISAFARPGEPVIPMIEWAQRRLGDEGEVGWVSDDDSELVSFLEAADYEPVATDRLYHRDFSTTDIPEPVLPNGWVLRHVEGQHEADNRRAAAHAAFQSTMDGEMHLNRYLAFMRSAVYEPTRDLVAVSPEGRIAAFMVWWPDTSGIAQIEPFGTHPDFQRRGIGTALLHFGLRRMTEAGMKTTRVITNDWRGDATGFYEAAGFEDVGRVRWWKTK